MSIKDIISEIHSSLPHETQLVAVSKFHSVEKIREAYEAGQRLFGESRVQELLGKVPQLPSDIEWHFIGHLQRNKVKQLLPVISLIHSIDSEELLHEINLQASKMGKKVRGLLQVHIAKEETKFGFSEKECRNLFQGESLLSYPFVEICGLMGMATHTSNTDEIEREFSSLKTLYSSLVKDFPKQSNHFKELSMGMSEDYLLAVKYGSTLVRIGSKIFGERVP